MCKVAVEER
jgi:hypothetical protein